MKPRSNYQKAQILDPEYFSDTADQFVYLCSTITILSWWNFKSSYSPNTVLHITMNMSHSIIVPCTPLKEAAELGR